MFWAVIYPDPPPAAPRLEAIAAAIDKKAAALIDEARAAYALHAQRLRVQPAFDRTMTAEEKEASNLMVECVAAASFSGCGAGGRGGRGPQPAGAGAPPAGGRGQGGGRGTAGPSLPQHMNAELTILLGKKKTALEIRDFLSGEFEPVPLADVMVVLRARESAGQIKLVAKPAPGTAATKKKG